MCIRDRAELGAYVVGIGRNQKALDDLGEFLGKRGETWRFDLADLRDTHAFAKRLGDLNRLDVVLSNAGALLNTFSVSPQNVEVTLAVHLLSPYVLATTLAKRLTAEHARFIFMTSGGMYTQPFSLRKLEAIPDHYKGCLLYTSLSPKLSADESAKRIAQAQHRLVELRLFTAGLTPPCEVGPALIVVMEGFDAAGKGGSIRRTAGALDPRHVSVVPVSYTHLASVIAKTFDAVPPDVITPEPVVENPIMFANHDMRCNSTSVAAGD